MALLELATRDRYALACDHCGRLLAGLTAEAGCRPILWSVAVDQGWAADRGGGHRCPDCAGPTSPRPARHTLGIDLRTAGDVLVIRVAGALDAHAAPQLRTLLRHVGARRMIVLDLAAVTEVDPVIPALLLRTHQQLHRAGGQLRLAALSAATRTALRALNLQAVFASYDSVATALAGPAEPPGGVGSGQPR